MPDSYDVIVAGCGAMGSATLAHLAARGVKVLGLDPFQPPHTFGSSHGQTRIIREAYFEHPAYVPLVQRAYELWGKIEAESGAKLFLQTGGLMIGHPEGIVVGGSLRSAQEHKLTHSVLSPEDVARRFRAFQLPSRFQAVWEPRAGILYPELCVQTQLALAARHGATLRLCDRLVDWKSNGSGLLVRTMQSSFPCQKLILTTGAWLPELARDLGVAFRVERQVLFWFKPTSNPEQFAPVNCPIYLVEYEPDRFFYGFPDVGEGVKLALHHQGETVDPNQPRREALPAEIETMREVARRILPDAPGKFLSSATCLYTDTPDGHFILDALPESDRVIVASPCSGHGFKFSSAIGEALADRAMGVADRCDLSLFRLARFAK